MRISKTTLDQRLGLVHRRWALVVFAMLAGMDLWLKALTGVSTTDLQGLSSAAQFRLPSMPGRRSLMRCAPDSIWVSIIC